MSWGPATSIRRAWACSPINASSSAWGAASPPTRGPSWSAACATPLSNKIQPGEEPYIIVVGEAGDGSTDLFAAPAAGGTFQQLTFNRLVEASPRISPNGKSVAFVRRQDRGSPNAELVVLDLTTMAEATVPIADAGDQPRLAWSNDGAKLYLAGGRAYTTPTPPRRLDLQPVAADSM